MIGSFLKVIPLLLLRLWYLAVAQEFVTKSGEVGISRAVKSLYRPLTFLEHLHCIAIAFFHASVCQHKSLKEV